MRMVKTAEMENLPPSPPERNLTPSDSFFIKIDRSGAVREISSNSIITRDSSYNVIEKILKDNKDKGIITYKSYKLRYLEIAKPYGRIIVFVDKSFDNEVLRRLIMISILVCIISLVLVFIISLFLANVSLKPVMTAWERQKAFVADASHELRTPLAVITTNLDIVLDNGEYSVESQKKWLGNVKLETTRMTKLIEALLFIARSDSSKTSFSKNEFNLSNAVVQSVQPFEAVAIQSGIKIISKVEPDIFLKGTEGRIKQLIAILIDNAIKHTKSGDTVTIKTTMVKSRIQITVSDTGEGIPREHLSKIFDRFYKVDKSRAKREGSFGLGLSIAKCIVEEHNGIIDVLSEVGKGTEFRVVFETKKVLQ
jgi:signal transduction histidine kinase